MKKKLAFLGIVALVALVAFPATALAAKPTSFSATTGVAVTSLPPFTPAGVSGRVRIIGETSLAGPIAVTDWSLLAGGVISLTQNSNELFSSANPFILVAINGSSKGTFTIVTAGGTITGQYHLNVSNGPGCQIVNQGNWSAVNGTGAFAGVKARGTINACLNFVDLDGPGPLPPTFAGILTLSGSHN